MFFPSLSVKLLAWSSVFSRWPAKWGQWGKGLFISQDKFNLLVLDVLSKLFLFHIDLFEKRSKLLFFFFLMKYFKYDECGKLFFLKGLICNFCLETIHWKQTLFNFREIIVKLRRPLNCFRSFLNLMLRYNCFEKQSIWKKKLEDERSWIFFYFFF